MSQVKDRSERLDALGDAAHLQQAGDVRRRYIESLKSADDHDIGPLLAFARA